jgi:hypothetical protein
MQEATERQAAVGACLEQHRARWLQTFLSSDARRMTCVFEAPDAEAVRYAQARGELTYDALWSAERMAPEVSPACPAGYSLVVVERDLPPGLTLEKFRQVADAAAGCRQSHRLTFVESFLGTASQRAVCVYYAPDAEAVRISNHESNLPVRRAWPCTRHSAPPASRAIP